MLSLVTLPILYRQLGGEAFGVFGLFFSVQVLLGVFDFGVGAAMQRDLAALQAGAATPPAADVVATLRSIERMLWGIVVGACVLAAAGNAWIAGHWLHVQALPLELVAQALLWMAIAASLQFIGNFYAGCLNGLRRHRQVNALQCAVWALRFVLLLWCVEAGVAPAGTMEGAVVTVLQAWAATNALHVVAARTMLMRSLPSAAGTPGVAHLRQAARFGLPLVAATTLIMVFNQIDKLAASRLLALDNLGRYTIVWSIAEVMYLMYQPIYTSFLPVFAGRHAAARTSGDASGLWQSIALAWRVMSIAVLPVAVMIFALPGLVILAWTGDAQLAESGGGVLRWIIAGAAVNAFLFIPFALQQAAGDLRPWTWRIAVALVFYAPLAILAIRQWGMQGAAAAWCLGSVALAAWLSRASGQSIPQAPAGSGFLASLVPGSLRTLLPCAVVAALGAWLPWPAGRVGAGALALGMLAVCGLVALRSQPEVWTLCMQMTARLRRGRALTP